MTAPSTATSADRLLESRDLSVHFNDRSALKSIDATFHPAEMVGLLGPNGAGKSTFLRVLAGLLPATHGEVTFRGEAYSRPQDAVIYVPQRSSVDWNFPVSVLDVTLMAAARRKSRWTPFSNGDRVAALSALGRVDMMRFADVQIGQLSGGQQQRVFLARALLQSGEVYLLDEPYAGVDVPTQELLIALFETLRTGGKTIIYATHDLTQAARSSDRILLLNRRLIADGPPSRVMTELNLRATFGGQAIIPIVRSTQPIALEESPRG